MLNKNFSSDIFSFSSRGTYYELQFSVYFMWDTGVPFDLGVGVFTHQIFKRPPVLKHRIQQMGQMFLKVVVNGENAFDARA